MIRMYKNTLQHISICTISYWYINLHYFVAEPPSLGMDKRQLLGTEIGKNAAEKSHGLFSAEDWQCNKWGVITIEIIIRSLYYSNINNNKKRHCLCHWLFKYLGLIVVVEYINLKLRLVPKWWTGSVHLLMSSTWTRRRVWIKERNPRPPLLD